MNGYYGAWTRKRTKGQTGIATPSRRQYAWNDVSRKFVGYEELESAVEPAGI